MTTYGRIDIAFTHGEGSYLYSEDGKKYLDYASGIAVNAFGHCHPKLVEALKDQASKLWHTSNLYRIPEQEVVAEKLVENSCAERVFFCKLLEGLHGQTVKKIGQKLFVLLELFMAVL